MQDGGLIVEDGTSDTESDTVHCCPVIKDVISYSVFFHTFLQLNKPCVFNLFATKSWKSRIDWVTMDGTPNFKYLLEMFGDATVPIANCQQVQYDAQPKTDMLLKEYVEYWQKYIKSGYAKDQPCLYLKDWHFVRDFPDYEAYDTPIYFCSDWLNEFWDTRDEQSDDYRFVYMGPKGSWTPFHADVFRSYSWSANICGKKKWILYPAGEEAHLRDRHGNLPYDVTAPDMDNDRYPNRSKACKPIVIIQNAGEIIFVPSGWHHQVYNLEDTISINHNWFNSCSIDRSWSFLKTQLTKVKEAIDDCRDMEGWDQQCQLIMRADTGMDYAEFYRLLHLIASSRLHHYCNEDRPTKNEGAIDERTYESECCDIVKICLRKEITSLAVQNRYAHICNDNKINNGLHTSVTCKEISNEYSSTSNEYSSNKSSIQETSISDERIDMSLNLKLRKHWQRSLTPCHSTFDLNQIRKLLEEMLQDEDFRRIDLGDHNPEQLLAMITKCL